MGHYDECRPGYCANCGAAPGNFKNGKCEFCEKAKKSAKQFAALSPKTGQEKSVAATGPAIEIIKHHDQDALRFLTLNGATPSVVVDMGKGLNRLVNGVSKIGDTVQQSVDCLLDGGGSISLSELRTLLNALHEEFTRNSAFLSGARNLPGFNESMAVTPSLDLFGNFLMDNTYVTFDAGHNNVQVYLLSAFPQAWFRDKDVEEKARQRKAARASKRREELIKELERLDAEIGGKSAT